MQLTITTTHQPATDLGFLLHKHPDRLHSHKLNFGEAHVVYPESTPERCTATLLLDVDPVALVRKTRGSESFALKQYVNDRPYVASSFLSVALNAVFRNTLAGKSKDRQEVADTPIPLEVQIPVLPCRGGEKVLRSLFEPLGYDLKAERLALDEQFPEWGECAYFSVTLSATCLIRDFLTHLYVLIPVLDNEKHYFIDSAEVEKLFRAGEGWLDTHPEKETIVRRYLKFRSVANEALAQLSESDEEIASNDEKIPQKEEILEAALSLHDHRLKVVAETLKAYKAKRVVDMGCGEGKLLKHLIEDRYFETVLGCDVSTQALERAHERLRIDRLPSQQRRKVSLMQTALTYRDKRLENFDGAAIVEVIEHLDVPRLEAFRRVVFEFARPGVVVLTTPNAEYNALFEDLPAGKFRHSDHRFEWTREEFSSWAQGIAEEFGYTVDIEPVGEVDVTHGAPTQMGVFVRQEEQSHA